MQDYYRILNVTRYADHALIKKSYRKLAKQYHPDKNPDCKSSEETFKLICEAYEFLSDSQKKERYDLQLQRSEAETFDVPPPAGETRFEPANEVLRDFLKGFYVGQGDAERKTTRGEDLRYNLKISLEEAALGTEKEFRIPCLATCHQCFGTGSKAGVRSVVCGACRGKGKIKDKRGFLKMCRTCLGAGSVQTECCLKCGGSGTVKSRRTLRVHVPAGIETGTRLQLEGMGLPGDNGGLCGDLFVVIHVARHQFFTIRNLDLVCTIPVPVFEAVSGCTITVPTLHGKKVVTVAPGSQSGREIRIRGQGVRSHDGKKRGALIVQLKVEMPKGLTREESRLLKSLSDRTARKRFPQSEAYRKKMDKL